MQSHRLALADHQSSTQDKNPPLLPLPLLSLKKLKPSGRWMRLEPKLLRKKTREHAPHHIARLVIEARKRLPSGPYRMEVRGALRDTAALEVVEGEGNAVWGGNDPIEAVQWLRRSPINSRLLVSGWDAEDEDAMLVGQPIDITKIVFATLAGVL
jgi:hypothetical protein